ncbi:hypothetical protein K456DRAFT_35230 [Colletotrichum gloeosporioides 23]|nr:hypothetical protein K456DRAFT_35230 [Colletotrichum gloeosporioides 23]
MSGCPLNINCDGTGFFPAPYSDIAGFGVVIGFIGTAYIVFILLVIYYLVAYKPDKPPFSRKTTAAGDMSSTSMRLDWKPNPVDTIVLALIRRTTRFVLKCCRMSSLVIRDELSVRMQDCFDKVCKNLKRVV